MDDLDALASDLGKARQATDRFVSKVVLDYGDKIADTMRQNAPVASGELRDSIGAEVAGRGVFAGGISVDVGPTVWYAHFPERGTSRQSPRPYAGPAFDQHVEGFVREIFDVAADNLW